ncbi:secreted protein, partial [sediment metagenome]
MKTMTMFFFAFAFVFASAQDTAKSNEISTLSCNKSLGFYGAAGIGYSQMEAKDALTIGGRT